MPADHVMVAGRTPSPEEGLCDFGRYYKEHIIVSVASERQHVGTSMDIERRLLLSKTVNNFVEN